MPQTDSEPAEGAGPAGGPKAVGPHRPPSKPLPDFHPKPKSLGDVTDRLVANRLQDGRGPSWWKRYGPWIAVGQLAVLLAVGLYAVISSGALLQVLLALGLLTAYNVLRWLFLTSD